jgi:hypothetical protein
MGDEKLGRTGRTGFSGEVSTELEVLEVEGDRTTTIWYRVGTKLVRIAMARTYVLADKGKKNGGSEGSSSKG